MRRCTGFHMPLNTIPKLPSPRREVGPGSTCRSLQGMAVSDDDDDDDDDDDNCSWRGAVSTEEGVVVVVAVAAAVGSWVETALVSVDSRLL